MAQSIQLRWSCAMMPPHYPLRVATIGVLLLLMPRASTAQESTAMLQFLEERSAVLGERFRNLLDRSPETQEDLLGAISDLRAIAEAMKEEKPLILGAFPKGVPQKEFPILIKLVWELGYQAGTAEMLADEWERLLASMLISSTPEEKTDQ